MKTFFIFSAQFGACGLKISTLGDVIAGLPFTLTCKLNRTTGDTRVVTWRYSQEPYQLEKNIYSSWQCTASIQVSLTYPAGLSGSCQTVNGEEIYSLTMQNATQATGQIRWRCLHARYTSSIRLDVKGMWFAIRFCIEDKRTARLSYYNPLSFNLSLLIYCMIKTPCRRRSLCIENNPMEFNNS